MFPLFWAPCFSSSKHGIWFLCIYPTLSNVPFDKSAPLTLTSSLFLEHLFPTQDFCSCVPSAWNTALPQYLHFVFFQPIYIYAQISPPQRGLPWSSYLRKECSFSLSFLLPGITQHIHLYSSLFLPPLKCKFQEARALTFLYLTLSGAPITMPGHGRHTINIYRLNEWTNILSYKTLVKMNPWPIGTLTQLQTINLRSCPSLVSLWPALTQSFPYSWVTDMGEINWGWGTPVTVAFYLSRKRLEKGPPIFKQCFIGTWAPRNHPPTHLRDYYPVWLSKRTPIYLMFPASKKCQMGTAGKRNTSFGFQDMAKWRCH